MPPSLQRIAQAVQQGQPGRRTLTCYVVKYGLPQHHIPEARRLPARVTTVMNVLRFKEGPHRAVICNLLIDFASIERTVSCLCLWLKA